MNRSIIAASAAVGLILVGAVAGASIPGTTGDISGCYNTTSGQVRVVEAGDGCREAERSLVWNQTGQPGEQGEPGPQGPAGAAAGYARNGHNRDILENYPATVVTIDVPAGSYIVTAQVTARVLSTFPLDGASVICWLWAGENIVTQTHEDVIAPGAGHFEADVNMAIAAPAELDGDAAISVSCGPEVAEYADVEVSLVAVQVGDLYY